MDKDPMAAPMTSIRRRRRFVGWTARFALLVGGRAATCFGEIVFSTTGIGLYRFGKDESGQARATWEQNFAGQNREFMV
jgi:hypothetical protein